MQDNTREERLKIRNEQIGTDYITGISTKEIAKKYNMTIRNVQKIIKENNWKLPKKYRIKNNDSLDLINDIKNQVKEDNLIKEKELKMKNENLRSVYIYLIKFEEENIYIGQTNNIEKRMLIHISQAKLGKHGSPYINNLSKRYGEDYIRDKFSKPQILYVNLNGTKSEANIKEKLYQQQYRQAGYNILGRQQAL